MMSDTSLGHFFLNANMAECEVLPVASGSAAVISTRSPDGAESNEDAAAIIPLGDHSGILAIADGVGGHASGAEAARLALQAIERSVRGRAPEDELRTSILNGFEMANETVRALGVGAATTLAVVSIDGHWIRSYHAGDTGIIVTGQRGKIRTRTVDHSPTGYGVEAGLLNEHEAIRHEERHIVSNIVGTEDMRIEIGPSVQLAARDTVLMASDGLFDNLMFDDIVDRIRTGPMPHRVNELARTILRRMQSESTTRPSKPDDLTLVAFRKGSV